jgi:hypothetical protein
VNWWLRVTSWGWQQPESGSFTQREKARRSRLAAWLILGLFVGVVLLSPLGYQDLRARFVLAIWAVGLVGAAVLNRRGMVTLAGLVLVVLISGGLLFANLASPIGLTMGELPNFDAYVVSVVLAASVLPRASVFLVAAGNTALIIGNYLLQPHNANIARDAALYSSATVQTISFLVRPIALQMVLAVVAYLWVRGAEDAIRRADRAEEIALLERRDRARTFALEEGVRYLHQALSQWTTGDLRHRIPDMPVPILEQVRHDLNTFIERFGPSLYASFHLQRIQEEAQRLTRALEDWVQGYPALWPAPSGTALDRAVAILRYASQARPDFPHLPPPPRAPGGPMRSGAPAAAPGARVTWGAPQKPWPDDLEASGRPWPQTTSQPLRQPADSPPVDPLGPGRQQPPQSGPMDGFQYPAVQQDPGHQPSPWEL